MAGTRLSRRAFVGIAGGAAVLLVGLLGTRLWLSSSATGAPAAPPGKPAPSPAGTRLEATIPPPATPVAPSSPTPVRPQRLAPEAFGPLPPLALPGDGGFRPRYALTYERAPELRDLPLSADVYRLRWPVFTPDTVRDLSQRLGFAAGVERLGPGSFQVQDPAAGRLFVAHGRILYSRGGQRATVITADPAQMGEQTRRWLAERQLLPADAGPPRTRVLSEAGLIMVTFLPIAPQPLITPEPSITATLDGAGTVRELDILWPAEQDVSLYPLMGLNAAWEALQRGDGFVEVEHDPAASMPGRTLSGQARLTRALIGYALAAGTDIDQGAFLEPVYIFAGTVQLTERPEVSSCQVYLPALRDYPRPHG